MPNVKVLFKHVKIGAKFIVNDQEYTKTNFNKAWYIKNNQKVWQGFKKKVVVETDGEYFYNEDRLE